MLPIVLFVLQNFFTVGNAWIATDIEDRCTTLAVSKEGGTEGPMVAHTADCNDCDFRINKVPAMDWPEGSMRPIYRYKNNYPATISSHRGATWLPSNLAGTGTDAQISSWGDESIITAWIPQVPHTYALYEAGYGLVNEHGLTIGESTCAARFAGIPTVASPNGLGQHGIPIGGGPAPTNNVPNGKARIEVNEMSRLALERTRTAREAIRLMGSTAEELGFYAADWWSGGDGTLGEGGEALTVADNNEAWVFHILGDDTGESAVWVARRVPPGHIAAVANQFIIADVIPDNDDYMYSANIWEVAKRNGLWHSQEQDGYLNFMKTYGLPRAHSPYATHRQWRVMDLAAPSRALPPPLDPFKGGDYFASELPFSIQVDKALSAQDIMHMLRDHYEGSIFDMTKGLAAGPYGDPARFDPAPVDNMTLQDAISGSYERAISLYRTSYSMIGQSRGHLPDFVGSRVWFSVYNPSAGSYIPFYVAAESLPAPYTHGSLFRYDKSVAFWKFCVIGNYAARFYKYAMRDVVALQTKLENDVFAEAADLDRAAAEVLKTVSGNVNDNAPSSQLKIVTDLYTAFQNRHADRIMKAYDELFEQIVTKYHDGYEATQLDQTNIKMSKFFYPRWWLNATGYFENKPNFGPGVLMFEPSPVAVSAEPVVVISGPVTPAPPKTDAVIAEPVTDGYSASHMMSFGMCVGMITLAAGYVIGRYYVNKNGRHAYMEIGQELV